MKTENRFYLDEKSKSRMYVKRRKSIEQISIRECREV